MRCTLGPLLVFTFAAGCGDASPEILLWVEADYPMAANSRAAQVQIEGGDERGVPLEGSRPTCLPFSLSIVPAEGTAPDAELAVSVTLERLDGVRVTRKVNTHFAPGLRALRIHFEERCAFADDCDQNESRPDLDKVDRDQATSEIQNSTCIPLPNLDQCLAMNGCLALAETLAPVCVAPCPPPSTPIAPTPPRAPTPPSPASFLPCPPGWSPVGDQGWEHCEPWPIAEGACPAGQALFPGESACRELSSPCPAGEFPEPLPPGVLVVSASAGPDLGVVLAGAPNGAVIVLGRGTHRVAALNVSRPVTLRGACTTGTILEPGIEVLITAGPTTLQDLTIRATGTGVRVNGAEAHLVGLYVDHPGYEGIRGNDSVLEIQRSAVRASGGTGLRAENSTVTVGALEVREATASGLRISGTKAQLDDLAVHDVRPGSDPAIGTGAALLLRHGAQVELARSVLEGASGWTVHVRESSRLEARQLLVRGQANNSAAGLRAESSGRAVLEEVAILGVKDAGLYANDQAQVEATDLHVAEPRVGDASDRGTGVLCSSAATLTVTRLQLEGSARYGVGAFSRCRVGGSDWSLRRIGLGSRDGEGLRIDEGARVDVARIRIEGLGDSALTLGDTAQVQLRDLVALDGAPAATAVAIAPSANLRLIGASLSGFEEGLSATLHTSTTTLWLEDLLLDDLRAGGIVASSGNERPVQLRGARIVVRSAGGRGVDLLRAEADLEDLLIKDSGQSEPNFSGVGVGLAESQTTGARWSVTNVDDASILVLGGRLELEDLTAHLSRCRPSPFPQGCGAYGGSGLHLGIGQEQIFSDTEVHLRRFSICDHPNFGVRQAAGTLFLADGLLCRNHVGVLSDYEGRERERLLAGVRFEDNGTDFVTQP